MKLNHGVFTISLDFELYWGVHDTQSIEGYGDNLLGSRKVIPELLQVFSEFQIHATWATVGMLFFDNYMDLMKNIPTTQPNYTNKNLSSYYYLGNSTDLAPRYHFAPDLIDLIKQQKGQDIGSHTFSHYYCREDGQCLEEFKEDLCSALSIAKRKDITIQSFVFPKNQYNEDYLDVLNTLGISSYRGNEESWLHKPIGENKLQRFMRLVDTYINISGYHTYDLSKCVQEKPYNFPASRFLRPYSKKLSILNQLKLKRILTAMSHAARHNQVFHLWWHPHNFGINRQDNLNFLRKILTHFKSLEKTGTMKSLNMRELTALAEDLNGRQPN